MLYFILKVTITAIVVVTVGEIAKKSSLLAGLIVSIPLTTFLALIWLYWETSDSQKVIDLSNSTLLMIIPSLFFFLFFPTLLNLHFSFFISMTVSIFLTATCYFIFISILQKIGLGGF